LANSGAELGNWTAGGQRQMKLVLPAQGHIPEPPNISSIQTHTQFSVLKSHDTKTLTLSQLTFWHRDLNGHSPPLRTIFFLLGI